MHSGTKVTVTDGAYTHDNHGLPDACAPDVHALHMRRGRTWSACFDSSVDLASASMSRAEADAVCCLNSFSLRASSLSCVTRVQQPAVLRSAHAGGGWWRS